jgi:hypothetical protein
MKIGDLVAMKDSESYDPEDVYRPIKLYMQEYPGSGVILRVLDGGSHRKQTSYEVYWPESGKTNWHVEHHLRLVG